jgi:hypothetical protein
MKCATARPPAPSRRWVAALLAATGLVAHSAAAQELEPLPAPPPPASLPPVPPPSPPTRSPPNEVRFEPDEPDVTLLRLSETGAVERTFSYDSERWYALYSPVCQGPCSTRLEPGAYRLALAKGGRVVPVRGAVDLRGPATLRGAYIDRSVLRATGLIIGVAGTVGGFIMVVAAAQNGAMCDVNGICVSRGTTDGPLLAAGVALLVASVVTGSILTFQHDGARITVEPLALSGRAMREGGLTAYGASQPEGGAVALHF